MRSLFDLYEISGHFMPGSLAAIHPPAPGGSSPAWSVSSYRLTRRDVAASSRRCPTMLCTFVRGLPEVFAGVDIKVEGIKGPEFSLPHESAQDPPAASSSAPGTSSAPDRHYLPQNYPQPLLLSLAPG